MKQADASESVKEPFRHCSRQLAMELKQRQVGNPRYSLRAFAQTLGLSPAHVSKVLRGEKRLSLDAAVKVATRLRYSENETRQFCELVSRDQVKDESLKRQIGWSDADDAEFPPLSMDGFQVIADWYHCALRELTDCRDFDPSPAAVAGRLGITEQEASGALNRLVRLGLLKKQGGTYRKTAESFSASGQRPSHAIRHFHSQMLQKAREALDAQTMDERDISGITLAIAPDKIDLAKEEIRRFRRRMAKCLDTKRPSSVYQLNIQFFRLVGSEPKQKRKPT